MKRESDDSEYGGEIGFEQEFDNMGNGFDNNFEPKINVDEDEIRANVANLANLADESNGNTRERSSVQQGKGSLPPIGESVKTRQDPDKEYLDYINKMSKQSTVEAERVRAGRERMERRREAAKHVPKPIDRLDYAPDYGDEDLLDIRDDADFGYANYEESTKKQISDGSIVSVLLKIITGDVRIVIGGISVVFLIIIIIVASAMGGSSKKRKNELEETQNNVARLETELKTKDDKIFELESQINLLTAQIPTEAPETPQPTPEMTAEPGATTEPGITSQPGATNVPAPTSAPVVSGNYRIYVVRAGDHIEKIARQELGSESRTAEILELNNLRASDIINIGDEIKLPN